MKKKNVVKWFMAAGVSALVLAGCGKGAGEESNMYMPATILAEDAQSQTAAGSGETGSAASSGESGAALSGVAGSSEAAQADGSAYVGEYLDSDVNDPMLKITAGADGKYGVEIGIYRLTTMDDGIGELTEDGLKFTATDAAGNPIGGIITLDGDVATVTFTDSTWGYIQNGDTFLYIRAGSASNVPKSEQTGTAGSNMPIKDNTESR